MNAMQYKITLPNDYDMTIIRERVENNGFKTDGFQDLLLKAYLVLDSETRKEYAPLYLWKQEGGMNRFIFEGFYDNILTSFGWQQTIIAVPLQVELGEAIKNAKFVLDIEQDIPRQDKMAAPDFSLERTTENGRVLVYNPDKWKYVEFYFFSDYPESISGDGVVYQLLLYRFSCHLNE